MGKQGLDVFPYPLGPITNHTKPHRDLVMEICCALHNFRVRLSPWQPLV
jgi:hypothetical protein